VSVTNFDHVSEYQADPLAFLIIKKNFLQEECWNDLPKEVINATSTDDFKNLIDFYMASSMYTFD